MRPSALLLCLVSITLLCDGVLWRVNSLQRKEFARSLPMQQQLVSKLGLSDLALSTEARYTRHPALSDPLAPFMDHPGSIEHFPSGSFILPGADSSR